ncbi:YidB family protein [Mesorhizobium sp. A623]
MSLNLKNVAVALIGLLAYKNRDKLGELISGASSTDPNGGGLAGGLNDMLDRLRNAGAGDPVDSWVGTGPNKSVQRDQIEKAIDPDTLKELSAQTGLSIDELVERLTKDLPDAVDGLTPEGRMPSGDLNTLLDNFPGGRPA